MSIASIFFHFFETNPFTVVLAIVVVLAVLLRRLPKRRPRPDRSFWIAALLLGLLLRAGWIAYSPYEPKTAWQATQMLESDATHVHALELSRGIWFHNAEGAPTARRPIGYPMLLGLCYAVFGHAAAVAWALNLLLYALSAYFLMSLARELFGPAVALWAGFLYAIYPISIYSVKLITDEHLFLPLWYGGLYLLAREIGGLRIRWAIPVYGLLFGYAAMTRTYAIFMPLVIAFAYGRLGRSWKSVLAAFTGTVLVMQLLNLPWVIRNQKVFGVAVLYTATNQFVYPQFNSTANFYGEGRLPRPDEKDYSPELEAASAANEGVYHAAAGHAITHWAARHPLEALHLGVGRFLVFIGWDKRGVWPLWFQFSEGAYDPSRSVPQKTKDALEWTAYASYYVLFFLFFVGAFLAFWERRFFSRPARIGLGAVGLCFVLWGALQMVIYPDRKYRFPLEPLMLAAAAYGLCRISGRAHAGGRAPAPAVATRP